MATEDQIAKFWQDKEEALGGKILFQTYVTYLGEAGSDSFSGRGGLLYIVNDRLYFEDFEKQNAMMALFNRKDDNYEKTEFSFLLSDVESMQRVSEKDAKECIRGIQEENSLSSLTKFSSLFTRGYWRIGVKNRSSLFFEIMDDKGLNPFLPSL